jgi:hypothetical protein
MKFRTFSLLLVMLASLVSALAVEPSGNWIAPDPDGGPWRHPGTGLVFPPKLGTHRLAGEFRYQEGGGSFIRYESLDERSRGDIFFFPAPGGEISLEEQQRLVLQELESVTRDLEAMTKEGRYKGLLMGEIGGGSIDLWKDAALPMAARSCEVTRVAQTDKGPEEARIKQWAGVIYYKNHLITIRQMRPVSPEDDGAAAMQAFAHQVTKIIKDPALRKGVAGLIDRYMENPLSDESVQASAAILAYLQGNPDLPISIPEHPVQDWLGHCAKVAPGTEEHLLRAFMIGSARAALAGGDAKSCLNAGAAQFARIYRELHARHPAMTLPQIDSFLAAAVDGRGGEWLLGMRQ